MRPSGELPLKPGSQTRFVTGSADRDEYFQAMLQAKLVDSIRWQAKAFRTGVLGVVPECALSLFSDAFGRCCVVQSMF